MYYSASGRYCIWSLYNYATKVEKILVIGRLKQVYRIYYEVDCRFLKSQIIFIISR